MKRIMGYDVIGLNVHIPIADFEHDGRYYELLGFQFQPVWSE